MKPHIANIAVLLSAAMLVIGCQRGRNAKDLVESFLDSSLVDNEISELTFTSLDSTHHLNDSVVDALRATVAASKVFKRGLRYGQYAARQRLHYISATYKTRSGEKVKQTFYMDKNHTAVVCVKLDYVAKE